MKTKLMSLFALSALLMTSSLTAHAQTLDDANPNGHGGVITVKNHIKGSMWVTVYNYFGSIRDVGCINSGDLKDFNNYYGPLAFKVRAEVAEDQDCHGRLLRDLSVWISVDPLSGKTVSLEQNIKGGDYFFNKE